MNILKRGDRVLNFNKEAKVVRFHDVTGDPVLEDAEGNCWVADVMNCVVIESVADISVINGL